MVHLLLQLEGLLLLLLHLLQVPVVLIVLPLSLLDGAPVGQPGLQTGSVLGRLQPGVRVPGGRGQDRHLPQAGVEATQDGGPGGGLVGRGLAEDLVREERTHGPAQLEGGTSTASRTEDHNQEPADITQSVLTARHGGRYFKFGQRKIHILYTFNTLFALKLPYLKD